MSDKQMKLSSGSAVLCINETGEIEYIENKETGDRFSIEDKGFYLFANNRSYFVNPVCLFCEKNDNEISFTLDYFNFKATVKYTTVPGISFFEKVITFENKDSDSFFVDEVTCQDLKFSGAEEILLHDDKSLWHVPTNFFVRYKNGGVALGLEYPYWFGIAEDGSDAGVWESDRIKLGYSAKVNSDKSFICEKTFIGIYTYEGVTRKTYGPYPHGVKTFWPDMEYGGLSQHFPGNVLPNDAGIPEETLDFGEIHAMQNFFRYYLPKQSLPEDGYFIWQNGWWAGLTTPDINAVDPLANSDVHDLMTFKMYFGHATHPSTEPPYVREARIDPVGFPVINKEDETEEVKTGTWHAAAQSGDDSDFVTGYTDEFAPPNDYKKLMEESGKKGVHIASFSTPNNSYVAKPEWLHKSANGETGTYFGTKLSCPACKEYMDYHFNVLSKVIDCSSKRYWAFDGRWISYKEIAGYDFGEIAPDPCYAEGHGHVPGEGKYLEWKNIEEFKSKLRLRYPNMCIEQYYGLKRGGAWSMTSLNADENYYEMGSEENNRLQTYCNENDRFRPTYINYSSLFGSTPSEFEYSIISALSCSSYCQIAGGYRALKDFPESRETLKKWKTWATDNHKYLLSRQTLFGFPGEYEIDGSVHIIDNEGYIFLFSVPCEKAEKKLPLDYLPKEAKYTVIKAINKNGENAYCEITEGREPTVKMSGLTAALIKVN